MSLSPRPNQVGSAPYAASSSLTAQVSPTRPQPALGVGAAAQGVHDAVQVGADLQAVQAHVVADVDDRGHLGAGVAGRARARRAGTGRRRCPPARTTMCMRPSSRTVAVVPGSRRGYSGQTTDHPGAVTTQPDATPGDGAVGQPGDQAAAGAGRAGAARRQRVLLFVGLIDLFVPFGPTAAPSPAAPAAASSTSPASRAIVLPLLAVLLATHIAPPVRAGEADHPGGPGRVRGLRAVRGRSPSWSWLVGAAGRRRAALGVHRRCWCGSRALAIFAVGGVRWSTRSGGRTTTCPSPSPSRTARRVRPAAYPPQQQGYPQPGQPYPGYQQQPPPGAYGQQPPAAPTSGGGYPPAPGYPPYQQQQPPYRQQEQPPSAYQQPPSYGQQPPSYGQQPPAPPPAPPAPPAETQVAGPYTMPSAQPAPPTAPSSGPPAPSSAPAGAPGGFGGGRHRTDPAGHRPHPVDQPGEPAPRGRWHAAARARRRGADRAGTLSDRAPPVASPDATA